MSWGAIFVGEFEAKRFDGIGRHLVLNLEVGFRKFGGWIGGMGWRRWQDVSGSSRTCEVCPKRPVSVPPRPCVDKLCASFERGRAVDRRGPGTASVFFLSNHGLGFQKIRG